MLSESARMTTAREASYRVPYPNSKQRAVKIVALDRPSAAIVNDISKHAWHGAAFFTSLSFTAPGAPGDASGKTLQGWLEDIAGRTMNLVEEVAAADFVVVITTAGEDARSVSVIADVCKLHNKSLVGLIVPKADTRDEDITASLRYLRPYTRMLVVASGSDYVETMLTALRA